MSGNIERLIFLSVCAVVALGLTFALGLYSGIKRNGAYDLIMGVRSSVALVFDERENLVTDGRPIHFLQPARHPGQGVTKNTASDAGSLVLVSGYMDDGNALRLMRRDGTVLARWDARFSEHFPDTSFLQFPPATDRNVDLHGAVMLPDGSVVFNYEYFGTVKLGRCGAVEWTIEHETHHSVERSEKGGFWIPGRERLPGPENKGKFPPFTLGNQPFYLDDLILKVSDEGKIQTSVSLMQILVDAGLMPILTANGYSFDQGGEPVREFLHLNKISELSEEMAPAFSEFEAGDLALSIRKFNMIVVVDPDTWEVKWYQVGPWLRQHDPEFRPDGTIAIFNNNTFRFSNGPNGKAILDEPLVSNIITVNPTTGETKVTHGEREGQEFLTVVRGKHDFTPGGGVMITEFQAGRIFEVAANGEVVWEFVNRYDEDEVAELTEGRAYPASYFDVSDWSCP